MGTPERDIKTQDGEQLPSGLKIALVHERLNLMAGSEKVLCALHEAFPRAPIYTALTDSKITDEYLPGADIHTSFLQKMPLKGKYQNNYKFLPLFMLAFEQFNFSDYDVVISSSHCAAKAIITKPESCHISYCYTPMRYAWDLQHSYTQYQGKLIRSAWAMLANYVRMWDLSTAFRVDYFIAISRYIARRIEKFYGKPPSAVIFPPVEIERFSVSPSVDDYYLVVSRFAAYKRVDLIVEAFNRLGWRLVVVGTGEQEKHLKNIAGPNIEFRGYASDNEVADLFSHCKASVVAAEEDFGINMVESLASGRPVVAYGVGGSRDIVQPGLSGVLYPELTVESLVDALKECDSRTWNAEEIRQSSLRFSRERFKQEFKEFTAWALADFERRGKNIATDFRSQVDPEKVERL